MHDSQLHARHLSDRVARADDHRARHRAEAIDLLAAHRRARLRALVVSLARPRAVSPRPARPAHDPCPETPKAAA